MARLLIVVDYQNDFVSGALGFLQAKEIEQALCRKIISYQAEGETVIYTMDTHEEDYLDTQEGKMLPVPHCVFGTEGWQLYGEVKKLLQGCSVFEKNTFGSADLFYYLRKKEYTSVELAGVVTNICVIANAVLAKTALPEAEIIVDAECVAAPDAQLQEKTLDVLESLQITVQNRKNEGQA